MFALLTEEHQQGLLLNGKAMAQEAHSQISQMSNFSHREVNGLRIHQYLEGMLETDESEGRHLLIRVVALHLHPIMTMDTTSPTENRIQEDGGVVSSWWHFQCRKREVAYHVHSVFSEWTKLPFEEFCCLLYTPQSGSPTPDLLERSNVSDCLGLKRSKQRYWFQPQDIFHHHQGPSMGMECDGRHHIFIISSITSISVPSGYPHQTPCSCGLSSGEADMVPGTKTPWVG